MTGNRSDYLEAVLARAESLRVLECASARMPMQRGGTLRAGFAALVTALLALYPSVSAAAVLL